MSKEDKLLEKSRYPQYVGKQFRDESKNLRDGDMFAKGVIFRFKNGFLDGADEPAIETEDGHIEYWQKGQISLIESIASN